MSQLQEFSELLCENHIHVDYSTLVMHCRRIYKEVVVSPMSICLTVGWRDGCSVKLGSAFGADTNKGMDAGFFSHFI